MFEITSLAAKDTFIVELVNANDDPLLDAAGKRLTVTVYGPGSKPYNKAQSERTQRMMNAMAGRGKVKMNAKDEANENARFLAACTVSFDGWHYQGANDEIAIHAAYLDKKIGFIADQVQKAVGDWANFTASASTN
jgi:hypothetical protein